MPKILIVEDEPDIQEVIQFIVENAGYQTIVANNGKEGLRKAIVERPDLIITDVVMPLMGGYEFYKKLKENKVTAIIPVLILTARGAMEESFNVIGADGFLAKPFEDYVLLSKVATLLSRPTVLTPESLPQGHQNTRKVLVCGVYPEIVSEIVSLLSEKKYQVKSAFSGGDVISKVVVFEPQILLLNIHMSQEPGSAEIIKVIHMLPKLKDMPILLYSYYRISDLGSQSLHEKALDVDRRQRECIACGATEYLGRYSEFDFIDKLKTYLPGLSKD